MKPEREVIQIRIYQIRCQCGFYVSALGHDSVKAAMLDHVVYAHRDEPEVKVA